MFIILLAGENPKYFSFPRIEFVISVIFINEMLFLFVEADFLANKLKILDIQVQCTTP